MFSYGVQLALIGSSMNREVYKHLLQTYGRSPAQWIGLILEIIRDFIIRVYIVVIMAQTTTSLASGNYMAAKKHTVFFLIAYVTGTLIGTIGQLISYRSENRIYNRLTLEYYEKITNKDMEFYRNNQTGYLASSFRQYLDGMTVFMRFIRGEALAVFISLTIPVIVLFISSKTIGLLTAAIMAVQIAYIRWTSKKVNKYRQITHEIYRKVTAEVSDEITNIVAFKSAGAEKIASGKVSDLRLEEMKAFDARHYITTMLDLPRSLITAFAIFISIYLLASQPASNNPKTLGLIVLTLTYLFQIVRNVGVLPGMIMDHDDMVARIYPTLAYLDNSHEKIRDPESPVELKIDKARIEFKNVSFAYPASNNRTIPVFNKLNISIAGGEQIGIVGLSGAGKSTLANLLLRFDEIDSGSIKIDDIDIRDVKQAELRRKIAYVPQEPLLFHRTVRENIAYYNDKATDASVQEAAKAAHAHEFIIKLPDGYDTIVGERGVKLSGGQKQRIVIARAVLKHAPIMLFDEATSALDSESEQIIKRALPEILGKQTAIIIAHRLSTVAGLDRIIVMHDGKVVEEGSHSELLRQKGRYYSLWQKQISATES